MYKLRVFDILRLIEHLSLWLRFKSKTPSFRSNLWSRSSFCSEESNQDIDGVSLWGTDRLPSYLEEHIRSGSSELEPATSARLVVGNLLAEDLDLTIGDRVILLSTRNLVNTETLFRARPRLKQFEITGIYETALTDFDATYVFTDINTARQLLDYKTDEVTRL